MVIKKITKKVKRHHIKEVMVYGAVGVIALFTQTMGYLFLCDLKTEPLIANLVANIVGMFIGYYGHTRLTFRKVHHFSHKEFIKYGVTALSGFAFTSVGIYILVHLLHQNKYFGVLPMFISPGLTFLISKFWTFK